MRYALAPFCDFISEPSIRNIQSRFLDGIPEESIETIFEEFRQVDGSSSREYEGTGLGLAIAQKMIRVLGGSIHVESEPDVGSVFTVSLPLLCEKKLYNPEPQRQQNSGKENQPITGQRVPAFLRLHCEPLVFFDIAIQR